MHNDERDELLEHFAPQPEGELNPELMTELQSMLHLHSISPQELFFKWESYSIKMGAEETKLNLATVRAFRADLLDGLVRENRTKAQGRGTEKRMTTAATPRTVMKSGGDVYGMLDGLVPSTPNLKRSDGPGGLSLKRKAGRDTSSVSKVIKEAASSPLHPTDGIPDSSGAEPVGARSASFAHRLFAGQVVETLNQHLARPEPPLAPPAEPRIKLTVNTDLRKFSYRPMAMHLSEASEVLDDRIDEFAVVVQEHYDLPDSAFGNAASQSTSEIIAVGRIVSDCLDGRLNAASLVLETSRRVGAGHRVPLKVDGVPSFEFFLGQIVALRGVNASGDYFSIKEILSLPLLPVPASTAAALETHHQRIRGGPDDAVEHDDDENRVRQQTPALTYIIGAGPYTAEDNVEYEPLQEICKQAASAYADVLILTGPFLDLEHPLIASGDLDLPSSVDVDADTATLSTVFRALISPALRRLAEQVPQLTILLIPSVRDVLSKHVSWPQEPLSRRELGLPRQARLLSNPVTVSLNEITVGVSSQDILSGLRQCEVFGPHARNTNVLARLSRHLVDQRHFFPLFPPLERKKLMTTTTTTTTTTTLTTDERLDDSYTSGAMLDINYLKLGEWLKVRPDILILPSALPPFAKVVESVLVINPGVVSKRKAPGTYAHLTLYPATFGPDDAAEKKHEQDDAEMITHKVFQRGRVDIIRI